MGAVYVVGMGPGGLPHLTLRAMEVLKAADAIVGYTRYVELIAPLTADKEIFSTGMTREIERCEKAIALAREGKTVAMVSSGDAGIYGMAGLVMQVAMRRGEPVPIEVIPGVPSFVSAAAILGAPLMHDFASISLSDLLTDWEKIEGRLLAAAKADFVIVLYNPKSGKRTEGLKKAVSIIAAHREGNTPVGIVRNATREGEDAVITTLSGFHLYYDKIDMLTIVIVGNSTTFTHEHRMITPRGYKGV
ncbi:MAG: precorrin-3B C(17)-methyltransferase [Deltaproteobacteria bacterium]|nr:precorrin-3B C(17)-methyltransferase [Deltaproteobacteria bacterium]